MYGVTTPNRHRPSRSQVNFHLPAQYDRPLTATNNDRNRDASLDSLSTRSLNFQANSAPYINGKKNNNFFNPSLASNNVFYDHNYGYKNDLPNDRLLSPVRNDRFNKKTAMDNSFTSQDERRPITPPKGRRPDVTEDRFTRTQTLNPRKIETEDYQTEVVHKNGRFPREKEAAQNDRRNSNLSQNDPIRRKSDIDFQRRNEEEAVVRSQEFRGAGKPTNNYQEKRNEEYRDDRSETSSAMSTLSSANYVCPKCLNRHMAGDKASSCMRERQQDREGERRLADYNVRLSKEEEAKKRAERARRVDETRDAQERLNEQYYAKLDERRSPKKEGVTALNSVFAKQDEMRETQKALGEIFRRTLKDQIMTKEQERDEERRLNKSPYSTSLQVRGGYHNKYVEDPYTVRTVLQDQVEEKYYRQQRDREADKRSAQYIQEQAMRSQEEEDMLRRERSLNQKRELKDALQRSVQEKEANKRQELMNKSAERFNIDRVHAENQRRQQEQESSTKKQLFDFKQGLMNQLEQSSYKKRYEERKMLKEATSFDPKRKTKKTYPCGDCSMPYEKAYLTKWC